MRYRSSHAAGSAIPNNCNGCTAKRSICPPCHGKPKSTPKIVVFHDRNQCSNCQLGRISDWDEIIAQLDSIQPAVPVYFIIAPPKEELNAIRQKILELKLQRYRIEIDSTNRFMQQNKAIPADALFHTLLLDGQNRIVVVGSPLFNNKMWKIYCSEIKRLCEQDGKSYE